MSDVIVRHMPRGGKPPEDLHLRINGPDANFRIGTEKIRSWSLKEPELFLLDLLDIAGAVFASDRRIKRGGDIRSGFGRDWHRHLEFQISVRCPELWSRDDIIEALTDAVGFLTDDVVSFRFEQGEVESARRDYLPLSNADAGQMGPGEVILFSGGLDSLAGAIQTLEETDKDVILVTHRSAQKIIPFQDELAALLDGKYRGRVRYIPIRATLTKPGSRDSTQRSRSFLFAAFGFVIANLVGATRISFFENGVVSQNLPISPQVIGTMATRTTHPLALAKLEHLLSLINGASFPVRNPFAWRTKTEVVTSLRDHGAAQFIPNTSSCNQVWMRSTQQTHCGACSQCLDRRFAILAAGLATDDPATNYEIDVLAGSRPRSKDRTMALDWSAHAVRLAGISEANFIERFLGELSRLAMAFPGQEPESLFRKCLDLQRRHGGAVKRVLELAATMRMTDLVEQTLPATSLLRMFLANRTADPSLPVFASKAPGHLRDDNDADSYEPDDEFSLWPLRFALSHRGGEPVVTVTNLGEVVGKAAAPAHCLLPQFQEDLRQGRPHESHRFVEPGSMCPEAGITPNAVAQNVRRCRKKLAEYYHAIEGSAPEGDLLIESAQWNGYRLDPESRIVPIDDNA